MLENFQRLQSIFDKNRMRIILALFECDNDVCGCDLVLKLGLAKNLLSYHLNILKDLNLIAIIPCGRKKFYKLTTKGVRFSKILMEMDKIIFTKGTNGKNES